MFNRLEELKLGLGEFKAMFKQRDQSCPSNASHIHCCCNTANVLQNTIGKLISVPPQPLFYIQHYIIPDCVVLNPTMLSVQQRHIKDSILNFRGQSASFWTIGEAYNKEVLTLHIARYPTAWPWIFLVRAPPFPHHRQWVTLTLRDGDAGDVSKLLEAFCDLLATRVVDQTPGRGTLDRHATKQGIETYHWWQVGWSLKQHSLTFPLLHQQLCLQA